MMEAKRFAMQAAARWMAAAALALTAASAAQGAPEVTLERVSVVSAKYDPDWRTYQAYVSGMDEFDAKRAQLAPHAALRFLLVPSKPQASLAGLRLSIESDDVSIPVPLGEDGGFVLPRNAKAVEQHAELTLSRQKGWYRWRADVRSPDVPEGMRRLGDLRLECAVRWAVERNDILAPFRAILSRAGTCDSRSVRVEFFAARPVSAVFLVQGGRREALEPQRIEEEGLIYTPPLHDASWPDDTLVQFSYR